MQVRATLLSILQQDYAKTRQCSLTITATVPSVNIYGWTMAKRNPHLENFNRGYGIDRINIILLKVIPYNEVIGNGRLNEFTVVQKKNEKKMLLNNDFKNL